MDPLKILETFKSKTLEIKDKIISPHNTSEEILVSNDSKKKEDKKITIEKFIDISRPSKIGKKSFKFNFKLLLFFFISTILILRVASSLSLELYLYLLNMYF